jgi:hypothetical protein
MSKFYNTYSNTNQNHPLQQNSQNFLAYKKYVSIHSEDRDALSYPNSTDFEIELPEDITNISTMKLCDWAFPSNYDTFSILNSNVTMLFKFTELYNPSENGYAGLDAKLQQAIYEALNKYNSVFTVVIEEGFYIPALLATELTNKFNAVVSNVIIDYLNIIGNSTGDYTLLEQFTSLPTPTTSGYSRFIIVFNNVSQKIWFGNKADSFQLLNEDIFLKNSITNENLLCKKTQVPDFSNWGLPGNVGFSRCNITSKPPLTLNNVSSSNYVACNNYIRFYYGDNIISGDNGYWLTPTRDITGKFILPGAIVQFIECPYKINIFGPSYIYMEIYKYNCIDETQPYNISKFTLTTNETNGIVNSAFAKIPIVSTPTSQYYDGPSNSYKFFDPPVERIRRLKFRLRYHNGELVNFSNFEYSFTLEFSTLLPMINRAVNLVNLA